MFAKTGLLIAVGFVVAATLLCLRQQRTQLAHDSARTHREIDRARQDLWDLQVQIAERTDPKALEARIEATGESFEPVRPHDEASGLPAPQLAHTGSEVDEDRW